MLLLLSLQVTVVLKRLFTPDEAAEGGSAFVSEMEADVTAECKKLGTIEKVGWVGWCVPLLLKQRSHGERDVSAPSSTVLVCGVERTCKRARWGCDFAQQAGYELCGGGLVVGSLRHAAAAVHCCCRACCWWCCQVRVFAQHPEGVVTVRFKQAEPAEACVSLMDGRFFGGNKLVAHMWDGFTQYHGVRWLWAR